MDLVSACRVFVQVAERGSVTAGSAAIGMPQPAASRRIAALERHLGAALFDRSGRAMVPTPFGRAMMGPAERLVRLADTLEIDAEQARLEPVAVAVPEGCPARSLVMLHRAAHVHGVVLDLRPAHRAARTAALDGGRVRAALMPAAPDRAAWQVPLGVATADDEGSGPLRIESLRPGRGTAAARTVHIPPEDDVPHISDRLARLGHRAALSPAQFTVGSSPVDAASAALRSGGMLLCSAADADELGLSWRPLHDQAIRRGYAPVARHAGDRRLLRDVLGDEVGRCLGALPGSGER
ncbi:LysR family transcriptional regulator [Tomitella gaofuii]|uniref:LysR family transcriptional regulator n=1 Tax=Tomitella gaofuii TaxID=2760083 RepID=UPI001C70CE54|nr:LysR family transcriptional regulator [Tomitella gaofuii]